MQTNVVGNALRNEREMRGLSLEEISRETHIAVKHLEALERQAFELVPGEFYCRYYIKCFLRACGADENYFFNKYKNQLDELCGGSERQHLTQCLDKFPYSRFKRNKKLLLALLLLPAMLLVGWGIGRYGSALRRLIFSLWSQPAGSQTVERAALTASLPAAVPATPGQASPLQVAIDFLEPCWLRVEKEGQKLSERVYGKGESLTLSGNQILLVLGNPAGVRLRVNGREVTYLRKLGRSERLLLTPASLATLFQQ